MLCLVLTMFLLLQSVYCEERHCSRYHYEDQLLEKMIRMEVKVEGMEKEILKTNNQVLKTLDDLQREQASLKVNKGNFEKEFNALKQSILTEANSVRDTLLTPTISFKARQPADFSLNTGQTMVFNNTMANHGHGYDNVTGIFTVPVGGTYLFTMHVCLYSSRMFYYGIVSDNEIQTAGHFYEDSTSNCFSADAIIVLEAGQKVWIKCLYGNSYDVFYEYDTDTSYNLWNTFSGVLIHK